MSTVLGSALAAALAAFTMADPNKDSALFGVRAINRAGQLSPVAFPTITN